MSKARDLANAGTALTSVSATELGYLDGVTSAVQTQIDSKIGSASAINPTIVDAKGDIIAATAADTVARLGVGANDTVLTADSSTATGLKWATPASGGITQIATITASASTSITFSSIPSTYRNLYVIFENVIPSGNGDNIQMRFNGVTSASYRGTTAYGNGSDLSINETAIQVAPPIRSSSAFGMGYIFIPNYKSTSAAKIMDSYSFVRSSIGAANTNSYRNHGVFNDTSAISSITFIPQGTNFSGVFTLFGVQ